MVTLLTLLRKNHKSIPRTRKFLAACIIHIYSLQKILLLFLLYLNARNGGGGDSAQQCLARNSPATTTQRTAQKYLRVGGFSSELARRFYFIICCSRSSNLTLCDTDVLTRAYFNNIKSKKKI